MRITTAVFAAAMVGLALTSCSSNSGTTNEGNRVSGAVTTEQSAATSAKEAAGSAASSARAAAESAASSAKEAAGTAASKVGQAFDQAKLATFVGAFRIAYPDLATGRTDASIEAIVTDTCPAIAAGQDEQATINQVGALAANDGTHPTPDQAQRIYQLVKIACP